MPELWFLGDAHGQFRHIARAIREASETPSDLVFLGDLELSRPLEEEIGPIEDLGPRCWIVHGNHDADSIETARFLFDSPAFPDRSLHGRVQTIAGIRVAGLGGVFGAESWLPPDEPSVLCARDLAEDIEERARQGRISPEKAAGLSLKSRSLIFWEDWHRLFGQPADILAAHEAPDSHPRGFAPLSELARSMGAKRAFHGHHHDGLEALCEDPMGRGAFRSRGVGLRGIVSADGKTIVPGALDADRAARHRPPSEQGRSQDRA